MTKKPKLHEPMTLRYCADDAVWHVASVYNQPLSMHGAAGTEPQWLQDILTVARVGGHCMDIPRPPPDLIVWFRVNPDFTLVDFIHYDI